MQGKGGTPGGTRTPNPQIRSLMLYPLSYGRLFVLRANASSAGSHGRWPAAARCRGMPAGWGLRPFVRAGRPCPRES